MNTRRDEFRASLARFRVNQVLHFRDIWILHRVSSSPVGLVDPSFRARSGRLELTVRRHEFNEEFLSCTGHDSDGHRSQTLRASDRTVFGRENLLHQPPPRRPPKRVKSVNPKLIIASKLIISSTSLP